MTHSLGTYLNLAAVVGLATLVAALAAPGNTGAGSGNAQIEHDAPQFEKRLPLVLPAEQTSHFRVRMEVATERIRPEPWALTFAWRGESVNCDYSLVPTIVSRSAESDFLLTGHSAGRIKPADGRRTLRAGLSSGEINQKQYLIKINEGDHDGEVETILLHFTRDPAGRRDTGNPICISSMPPFSTQSRSGRNFPGFHSKPGDLLVSARR